MDIAKKIRNRFWLKGFYWGMFGTIYNFLLFLLFSFIAGTTIALPIFVLIAGICVSIGLPLLVGLFSAPRKVTIPEFEEKEHEFENSLNEILLASFGPDPSDQLYVVDLNWIQSAGIDICHQLINSSQTKTNPALLFYLQVKLAMYFFNDGQYQKAIESLRKALTVNPSNFLANFRMAGLYESIGSGDNAIAHYEMSLKDPSISSNILKEFVNSQINSVKTKGPRVKRPSSGYQWMTG